MNDQDQTYLIDGIDYARVTNVLKEVGIIDARWFDEYAAIRGTFVHEATALFDRSDLDIKSVAPAISGYVKAWIRFRMDNPDIKILDVEARVISKKFRVAGRLDVLAEKSGKLMIIDKKAVTTLNPSVEIQTAAYEAIYREMMGIKGEILRKAVQLMPDGTYKARNLNDKNDLAIWMSAVNLYSWKRKRR